MATERPRVFISYSHDSVAHASEVRKLADWLTTEGGCSVELDQYIEHDPPRDGWNVWAPTMARAARRVLCVCTPTYLRRWLKQEAPGVGLGATFEAAVIRSEIAAAGVQHDKYFGVVFDRGLVESIPPENATASSSRRSAWPSTSTCFTRCMSWDTSRSHHRSMARARSAGGSRERIASARCWIASVPTPS